MKAVTKILAGATGLAAVVSAAPAAAQYGYGYPQSGYGYGYGNTGGGVIGSILNQILGGRSYGQSERYAVEQCVRAVEHRINTRGFDNEGGRYGQYGYGYGYNNNYRNYNGARVLSVTQVQRRSNGGIKVIGLATSGNGASYGQYGYGNPYGGGYGNPYGGGYGNPYGGYNNYGGMVADARFDCSIDRYGRHTDIDPTRNHAGHNYGNPPHQADRNAKTGPRTPPEGRAFCVGVVRRGLQDSPRALGASHDGQPPRLHPHRRLRKPGDATDCAARA